MSRAGIISGLALLLAMPARADSSIEEAQQAQLEDLRARVADEIQLAAYDLVDEMVHGWLDAPVFDKPTPVLIAGVTVPVGLGTGLAAMVENHLAQVVGQNPASNVQLVYCPSCTAVVVHSDSTATVISRGIDDPATIAGMGAETGRHALFVDIEAEGTWLVLRARLTRLSPELPIVWSQTVASSASTPALLRQSRDLKSADEARREYLDALRGRGSITVPLRIVVRTYQPPGDSSGVGPPPFLWLQSGVELGTSDARAWTSSLLVGYSFIPQAYQGVMAQVRINRLLTGRVRSLTRPDIYGFVGAAVLSVWGSATSPFQGDLLTADDLIIALEGGDPRTTFGALQVGLDLRLGERIGFSTFLENLPSMNDNPNMGNYLRVAGIRFKSMGTEVTFWF